MGSITLSSIYWAIPFGQSEIDTMMKQSKDVLAWFNNMQNPVPTWYLQEFYIQSIDCVQFKLKSPLDFSYMPKYGGAFKVFDEQRSGNICFGVEWDSQYYFVQFAGAPTVNYGGSPDEIVELHKAISNDLKERQQSINQFKIYICGVNFIIT